LAALYQYQHKFSQALTLHRRVLRVWEGAAGGVDLEIVPTLANLAGLLCRMRRYSEAEQSYRRALTLQESALGRRHADVATALNNLANVSGDSIPAQKTASASEKEPWRSKF
jgi:hypothetical protein